MGLISRVSSRTYRISNNYKHSIMSTIKQKIEASNSKIQSIHEKSHKFIETAFENFVTPSMSRINDAYASNLDAFKNASKILDFKDSEYERRIANCEDQWDKSMIQKQESERREKELNIVTQLEKELLQSKIPELPSQTFPSLDADSQ